jgi:hypothetical protein
MRVFRLTLVVLTLSFVMPGASAPLTTSEKDTGDCVGVEYTLPWNAEAILGVEVRGCSSTRIGLVRLEEKLASGGWNPLTKFVVNLEPGEVVWGGFCARDGVHGAELIAAGPKSDNGCFMIETPRLAWRVDLQLKRLEPMDPEGIVCDSPC